MPKLTRAEVLQGVLAFFPAPRYLEIGVARGVTFHALKAARKVAVDPAFRFDVPAARQAHPQASYHQVTSDVYFGTIVEPGERFDVIYLDGLHTAEQTLRDLLNALDYLAPEGIIVIDDVKPSNHVAALPDQRRANAVRRLLGSERRGWMGDVFRVLFFVDTFMQQLTWRTVAENHGQSVIWRHRRPEVPERLLTEVSAKSFDDLLLERDVLRRRPYASILEDLRKDRPAGAVLEAAL
jgi:hypothetical protein